MKDNDYQEMLEEIKALQSKLDIAKEEMKEMQEFIKWSKEENKYLLRENTALSNSLNKSLEFVLFGCEMKYSYRNDKYVFEGVEIDPLSVPPIVKRYFKEITESKITRKAPKKPTTLIEEDLRKNTHEEEKKGIEHDL